MSTDTHMQLPLPQIKCSPVIALVQAIRLLTFLSVPLDGKGFVIPSNDILSCY